jgi:uncharacterized protein (TIGR02246 family)
MSWSLSVEDDAAIRKSIGVYTSAWNERRITDFSNAFTENTVFINVGELFVGRAAIRARHFKIYENNTLKLKIEDINLRKLRKDVVVAHIAWRIDNSADLSTGIYSGSFTQFFLKEGNEWLIVSSQDIFFCLLGI